MFYADYRSLDDSVTASLRYLSDEVEVAAAETRMLEIWVADHAWHDGGTAVNLVTPEMVSEMADRFLTSGTDNDVYDWVRGIFGAEWGPHEYSNLIPPDGRITILLLDIDADNATESGVLGYFYSRDNQLTDANPYSNARLMFYMDSVFYATPDSSASNWSVEAELPAEIISTLAHEMQHMVHYYRKYVVLNGSSETWLNELASLAAEDLLSSKLRVAGPRGIDAERGDAGSGGVTLGRLPRHNYANRNSVVEWATEQDGVVLDDYATAYAFGAYMVRNFGGALFLRRIVGSEYGDYRAVVQAARDFGAGVSPTDDEFAFAQILSNWAAASIVSDLVTFDPGIEYNTGTWIVAGGSSASDYLVGSINLYNYRWADTGLDGPRMYRPSELGPQIGTDSSELSAAEPASNIFLYGGRYPAGTASARWSIELPAGLMLNVIVRNARE